MKRYLANKTAINFTYNFDQDHDKASNPPFPHKKVLQEKKWGDVIMISFDGDKLPRLQKMLDYRKTAKTARNCKLSLFYLSSLQFIAFSRSILKLAKMSHWIFAEFPDSYSPMNLHSLHFPSSFFQYVFLDCGFESKCIHSLICLLLMQIH